MLLSHWQLLYSPITAHRTCTYINDHTKTKQAWSTTLSPVSKAFFTSPFIAQRGTSVLHEAIEGPQSLASTRDPESAAELATPPWLMMNTIKRCRVLRPASYQQLKPGGAAVCFHIDAECRQETYTIHTQNTSATHATQNEAVQCQYRQ